MVSTVPGKKYGRLTVIESAGRTPRFPSGASHDLWLCSCSCGVVRTYNGNNLRRGLSNSCGCFRSDLARRALTTHGMTGTPEYRTWRRMIERCENPNHESFDLYGGRGILVARVWRRNFTRFFSDMGPKPRGCSIDRINSNKNYAPGNCRWATPTQQARNMRSNRRLKYRGQDLAMSEWAEKVGIRSTTLWRRLSMGWPLSRALEEPVRSHEIYWRSA